MANRKEMLSQEQMLDVHERIGDATSRTNYNKVALCMGLNITGQTLCYRHQAWLKRGKCTGVVPTMRLVVRGGKYYHEDGRPVNYALD